MNKNRYLCVLLEPCFASDLANWNTKLTKTYKVMLKPQAAIAWEKMGLGLKNTRLFLSCFPYSFYFLGDVWPWSILQHLAASDYFPRRIQSEEGETCNRLWVWLFCQSNWRWLVGFVWTRCTFKLPQTAVSLDRLWEPLVFTEHKRSFCGEVHSRWFSFPLKKGLTLTTWAVSAFEPQLHGFIWGILLVNLWFSD